MRPTKTKSTPRGTLLLVALTLSMPLAGAYHATRDDPPEEIPVRSPVPVPYQPPLPDASPLVPPFLEGAVPTVPETVRPPDWEGFLRDNTDTYPTMDEARDALLEARREAIKNLTERLVAAGADPDAANALAATTAFRDDVDPGNRTGGIGEWKVLGANAWRVTNLGWNGSFAFTTAGPNASRYPAGDSLLVSPAVDLSAFVLPTGNLPFVPGSLRDLFRLVPNYICPGLSNNDPTAFTLATTVNDPFVTGSTVTIDPLAIVNPGSQKMIGNACFMLIPPPAWLSTAFVQDQVNLVLKTTYNVNPSDGGQVLVFVSEPQSHADIGKSVLVRPMTGYGQYRDRLGNVGGSGFSGSTPWRYTAFDLTAWAGRTVWIGFRFVSGPDADADPAYFSMLNQSYQAGWTIDEVEVVAPAAPSNLKIYNITHPTYRLDPKEPLPRVATSSSFEVAPIVVNGGSSAMPARLTLTVQGAVEDSTARIATATLEPGGVWMPRFVLKATDDEGSAISIHARVEPQAAASQAEDARDNEWTARVLVSNARAAKVTAAPRAYVLDNGENQTVNVTFRNLGNVPETFTATAREEMLVLNSSSGQREPVLVDLAPFTVSVPPGKSVNATVAGTTEASGPHTVRVRAVAADGRVFEVNGTYFVHASRAPAFVASQSAPEDWVAMTMDSPLPPVVDDWLWCGSAPSNFGAYSLEVGPVPEILGSAEDYEDLKIRVLAYSQGTPVSIPYLALTYNRPYSPGPPQGNDSEEFWRMEFPVARLSELHYQTRLRAWTTFDADILPSYASGYADLWSEGGIALRVFPGGSLCVDDLRLTGVPKGRTEADRRELVRLTGDPEVDVNVRDPPPITSDVSRDSSGNFRADPWRQLHAATIRAAAAPTKWTPQRGVFHNGSQVLWKYGDVPGFPAGIDGVWYPPDALRTPPIKLDDAARPTLVLEHTYAFKGGPFDSGISDRRYAMWGIGVVAVEYLQPDGRWSPMRQVHPVEPYWDVLGTYDAQTRLPVAGRSYSIGQGFFHPSACRTQAINVCLGEYYYKNIDSSGRLRTVKFDPTHSEVSRFDLTSVLPPDVSREGTIRLVFYAYNSTTSAFEHTAPPVWMIHEARLYPQDAFGADALVKDIRLEAPYDWRSLGLGPGTDVVLNVTVRNDGIFENDFTLNVSKALLGQEPDFNESVLLEDLQPREERSILLPWTVPESDEPLLITARVRLTEGLLPDDNPVNDILAFGKEGNLRPVTLNDLGMSARFFPETADTSTPRAGRITLSNRGNVPLEDIVVERRVERFVQGRIELVGTSSWIVPRLEPGATDVPLTKASPTAREADMVVHLEDPGVYLVGVSTRLQVLDANTDDNAIRRVLSAAPALYVEGFERRHGWLPSDASATGEAEGFLSARAIGFLNSTSGLLPAEGNVTWTSPPLRLAGLQTAYLDFLVKYLLEQGYDGGIIEVSTDNQTWHPLSPQTDQGVPTQYRLSLTSKNPLQPGVGALPAVTGDSRSEPGAIDGWVPLHYDLGAVPLLSERTPFQSLPPPTPDARPLSQPSILDQSVWTAPWMITDATDEQGRWEIRNATTEPPASRWWSGYASTTGTERTVQLSYNLSTVPAIPENHTFTLSWWDRRPGNDAAWQGAGGIYTVSFLGIGAPSTVAGLPAAEYNVSYSATLERVATQNGWHLIRALVSGVNATRPLHVTFEHKSRSITVSNLGWEVRDVVAEILPSASGKLVAGATPVASVRFADATAQDRAAWVRTPSTGWTWEDRLPRPGRWQIEPTPDGRTRWRLNLSMGSDANIDSRLVTPAIDLSRAAGGEITLRLEHSYDLVWSEVAGNPTKEIGDGRAYQGGAVEIIQFNRTTDSWDPPRQLFTVERGPPKAGGARPPPHAAEGAPYPRTLVGAGDTFDKFFRIENRSVNHQGTVLHATPVTLSYAFSGDSQGTRTDTFDLTPYAGERVRIAFHGWTGPTNPTNTHHAWNITSADIIGNQLAADRVWVRLRLGTDASEHAGQWLLDQVQLTGRQYGQSIGVAANETRLDVLPGGNATLHGVLRNYGPAPRKVVAVGLRGQSDNGDPLPQAIPVNTSRLALPDGSEFFVAVGPFDLGPAGSPNATAHFAIRLFGGEPANYTIELVVLQGGLEGDDLKFAPAREDVPGRTSARVSVQVAETLAAEIRAIEPTPRALPDTGQVQLAVTGVNTGLLPIVPVVTAEWRPAGMAIVTHVMTAKASMVVPGAEFRVGLQGNVSAPRNYTVVVKISHADQPLAQVSLPYRAGTSETARHSRFESGTEGWAVVPSQSGEFWWATTQDEAHTGNASILYGLTNAQAETGQQIGDDARFTYSGGFTSGVVDLSLAGDAEFTFWKKSRLNGLAVQLAATKVTPNGDPDPACPFRFPFWNETGRDADWVQVRIPLADIHPCPGVPLLGGPVQFTFNVTVPGAGIVANRLPSRYGQGWRLDDVVVTATTPRIHSAGAKHLVPDGVTKEFTLEVQNTGFVPREFDVGLDSATTQTTAAAREWLNVTPRRLQLEPGERQTILMRLSTPSSSEAYPQAMAYGLRLEDAREAGVFYVHPLRVDLEPKPRADQSVTVMLGKQLLEKQPTDVEEGLLQDVSVIVANVGVAPSLATQVALEIRGPDGSIVHRDQAPLPVLDPISAGGEASVWTLPWKPPTGARGNYTLHVVVDPYRVAVDYDRRNDDVTFPLVVVPQKRPDVSVPADGLTISRLDGRKIYESRPGEPIRVRGIVENTGYADAKDVTVRLLTGAALLKEIQVPRLAPGESVAIEATQLTPAQSTTYQVVVFVPQLEVDGSNNAHSAQLGVYGLELETLLAETDLASAPGDTVSVTVMLANRGPLPMLLDLNATSDGAVAGVSPARVALASGEARNVTLTVRTAGNEPAGPKLAVLVAREEDTVRARLTVPIEVLPRMRVGLEAREARGLPGEVAVPVLVVNEGNVRAAPVLHVVDEQGRVVAAHALDPLGPGASVEVAVRLGLPAGTPPGFWSGRVLAESGNGTLGAVPLRVTVERGSALQATLKTPLQDLAQPRTLLFGLNAQGNVPVELVPKMLGLPQNVTVRFEPERLTVPPSGVVQVEATLTMTGPVPPGAYRPRMVAFPARDDGTLVSMEPVEVPLELKRGVVQLLGVDGPVSPCGSTCAFEVRVRNVGDAPVEAVPLHAYLDGTLANLTHVTLGPGETAQLTAAVAARGGRHELIFAVDPNGPHAADAPPRAQAVTVPEGIVHHAKNVPGAGLLMVLLAACALALAGRRRYGR